MRVISQEFKQMLKDRDVLYLQTAGITYKILNIIG